MHPEENNQSNQPTNQNSSNLQNNALFGTPTPAPTPESLAEPPRITTTLNVPVASPTHFDIVHQPSTPTPPSPEEFAAKEAAATKKSVKRFSIMSSVFGVLAVLFLATAIGSLVYTFSQSDQLTQAKNTIVKQREIISAVEDSAGTGPITSVNQVPVYKSTLGYIYLSDWNIKLKIPEDLTSLSYILDQKYRPSICFNGLKKGVQFFPAFADVARNPGGMGCLTRVATTEGNTDAKTGLSFGTKVLTHKEYSYFYTPPARQFSTEASELGLEKTAVQLIKNMIIDQTSIYE